MQNWINLNQIVRGNLVCRMMTIRTPKWRTHVPCPSEPEESREEYELVHNPNPPPQSPPGTTKTDHFEIEARLGRDDFAAQS